MPKHVCQDNANEFAFGADGPYRCHATTAVLRAQQRHGETEHDRALHWVPVMREDTSSN
jgi:hypothetical protein